MVIAARGAERGRMAREIEAGGARALFVTADGLQAADVHGLVKTTVDCWGRLDCAFHNAAVPWKNLSCQLPPLPKRSLIAPWRSI